MRNSAVLKVGLPLGVLAVVAMAALALWAFMGGATGGVKDTAGIKGLIEYKVFDAAGNLKASKVIHNTDYPVLHNAARNRLGVQGNTTGATNPEKFASIRACNNAAAGALCVAGNLTTNVNNPIDAAGAAGGDGVWSAAGTFTATGAAGPILTLQLTDKNGTDADRVVGASQVVNITLALNDTLAVTWTVTVD
ncbi:MAG: hypothetical protein HY686_08755 [Chloroflexi bacterium]|nr:hypothetical protein [Chloroflexota bacterium]